MKKILLASATVALLLGGSACSTDYDIYPDDMSKVLMFKDSGGRSVTVYSAQDQVPAKIVVLKGGVAPEQSVTATVRAMSQEEFNEYAANAGVAYSYLPSNCYTLGENGVANVSFAGGEGYKTVDVKFDVKAVGAYLEANPNLALAPAVPLVLECADGKVSENDNKVFITPEYRIPTIGFTTGGIQGYNLNDNDESSIEINLPIENQWNIGIKVEVDPTLVNDYNTLNGTNFTMMPANGYELPGVVTMPEGENTVNAVVKINRDNISLFDMLPLRITQVDVDGIEVDGSSSTVLLSSRLTLTVDMLSTNDVVTGDGGGLASLIDGDYGNWFHSSWSSFQRDDVYGSYVEYNLPTTVQTVGFDITTRPGNGIGIPTNVQLYADDNGSWTLFSDSEKYGEVLTTGGQTAYVGPFQAPKKFNKFRFCVKKSKNGVLMGMSAAYWNASEIVVYGL